jgi:long-chain acyl-CoA synthetase
VAMLLLIGREIAHVNAHLAEVANIRKFHLLTNELDHDDDEVAAAMNIIWSNN